MNKRITWGVTVGLFMSAVGSARAMEMSEALNCLSEIKTVCAGLELDLERCLKTRADKLSPQCSTWLQSAMEMVAKNPGTSACMADIKQHCPGTDANEMVQCVSVKKSQFSPECQKHLGNTVTPTPTHDAQ